MKCKINQANKILKITFTIIGSYHTKVAREGADADDCLNNRPNNCPDNGLNMIPLDGISLKWRERVSTLGGLRILGLRPSRGGVCCSSVVVAV